MFIAALFTIAKTLKQPSCPVTDELIKKPWYIYTVKYYSDIKRNTFELGLMRWMNLEPIIQTEVKSKREKTNTIYQHIHMEHRRMVLMNLFAEQEWRHRGREQTYG